MITEATFDVLLNCKNIKGMIVVLTTTQVKLMIAHLIILGYFLLKLSYPGKPVNSWKETSNKLGIEAVKNLIESLPLNKVGATIPVTGDVVNADQLTGVIAKEMANIRIKNSL
jgi:hypothetical protein